ncbi:MAG: hypothetical protein KA151_10640 [Piscinibacter sp.]|nr:hypothetical protein [Piscinibacter sp.]
MAGLNFTSLRRWRFGNSQAQDGRLLEQFFVTLDGSLKQLVRSGGAAARHDDIVAEVTKLLAEAPSWRTAYHIEQLMVPLYGGAALEVELQRRMTEMRKFDTVIAATYDALLADADEAARRACLGRLVNDLQWRYEQRNLKRHYTQSVTIKTSLIFFGAFIVFFLPKNVLDPELLRAMPRHVVLHMAISAGLVGAAFSMLIGLRRRLEASTLDELRNTQRLPFLLSRAVIGAGAGLILYYVMESGLIEGKILPDIAQVVAFIRDGESAGAGAANAALLILWCFISGFSEHFVPNVLARTEAQFDQPGGASEAGNKPAA